MSDDLSMTALEYALGTLPADERAAFARLAATDAAARDALAEWERKLAPMAAAIEPIEPDSAVLRALEQRMDPPVVGGNVVALQRSIMRWRSAATAMSAIAATLALYVGLKPAPEIERPALTAAVQSAPAPAAPATGRAPDVGGGIATASASRQNENLVVTANGGREGAIRGGLNVQPTREPETAPALVAALTPAAAPAALLARVDGSTNTLVVRRLAATAPAGSALRLWLLTPGAPPRALGVVSEETTRLALPRDVPLAGATIAATMEPAGATGDAPGGAYVYEGKLVRE
ncbi:MAG: anti-sigma factor [Rhodoblastus sp.]